MSLYRRRLVDPFLRSLLLEFPAVMVVGPRATGKTTTAARLCNTKISLDSPAMSAAFRADPDAALATLEEPVLLDEWQEVPAVLGAVKRAVDKDYRPGRFVLTGSVRADLETQTWPGTGRVIRLQMYGMTVREQLSLGLGKPFFDRLIDKEIPNPPANPPNLRDYVDLALRSGFPEPVISNSQRFGSQWLRSYTEQITTRDAEGSATGRDPIRLQRYMQAYALNTAGTATNQTIIQAAGINRKTALAYERLLKNLFIVQPVPAWTSNRLKRMSLGEKRYLVDAALAATILGLDSAAVMQDGDLMGRVLDTLVAAQLRSELEVSTSKPRLHHLRAEQGRHEIDLIAEFPGGKILAFEIKADAAPDSDSSRHLVWLREKLGDRFLRGIVFHTGPMAFELDNRITALPIASMWGST